MLLKRKFVVGPSADYISVGFGLGGTGVAVGGTGVGLDVSVAGNGVDVGASSGSAAQADTTNIAKIANNAILCLEVINLSSPMT